MKIDQRLQEALTGPSLNFIERPNLEGNEAKSLLDYLLTLSFDLKNRQWTGRSSASPLII
jgi:hypothetical protein